LKIQDGGGRHFKKSENSHILAAVPPILTKFGTVMQFDTFDRPDRLKRIKIPGYAPARQEIYSCV